MSAGSGSCVASFDEPEQRLVELEVVRLVGDLGEDAVARLVELEAVERDREVILRDLLVALVVARLALVDAVEAEGGFAPALAVEEALGGGGLFGHLPGGDRRAAGVVVELDVLAPLLGGLGGARRLRRRRCGERARGRRGGVVVLGFFFFGCASAPDRDEREGRGQRQTRATHLRIIFLAFSEKPLEVPSDSESRTMPRHD